MPLYEYQCRKCGKVAEKLMTRDVDAPMCCGRFMERVMSPCFHVIRQIGKVTAHQDGKEIYST